MKSILIAGLLVSTTAMAGKPATPNIAAAGAIAGAASQSAAYAHQGQLQGQLQGQSQGQSAYQKAAQSTDQANAQSTTLNEAKQNYENMYDGYVSAAYAPPMPVSNCEDGKSIGLVIPTVGSVSLGGSSSNKNCERLEQVRIGIATGDQDTKVLANAVLQSMLEKSYAEIEEEDDADTRPVTRPRAEPTASTDYDWSQLGG